jgi:hypothetical protein
MDEKRDATESLLAKTKKLLDQRGDLTLRQIAEGAEVGHEWVRKIVYGGIDDPGVKRLEKLFAFLNEYQAAKRFRERAEPRAN